MIQNVILTRNAVVTLNVVIKNVKKRWVTDTTSLSVLIPVWLDQILFELSALEKNPIFVPQTQEWRAATCSYLYNMFAKESPLLIDLHVHILLETIEWLIWIEFNSTCVCPYGCLFLVKYPIIIFVCDRGKRGSRVYADGYGNVHVEPAKEVLEGADGNKFVAADTHHHKQIDYSITVW